MSFRRIICGAALALALLAAGCGDENAEAPRGDPARRHGEAAVTAVVTVERMRAELLAASDLLGLDRREQAAARVRAATDLYDGLAAGVVEEDSELDRELEIVLRELPRLALEAERPDEVRDRMGLARGQLLDGVIQTLTTARARSDEGLTAQAAATLLDDFETAYGVGARTSESAEGRVALARAYGLFARSQSLVGDVRDRLGADRDELLEDLADLRAYAFPDGIDAPSPPRPADRVSAESRRIRDAVADRFGLDG